MFFGGSRSTPIYGHKADSQAAAKTPNVTDTLPRVTVQNFNSIRVTGGPEIVFRVIAIYGHKAQNATKIPNVTGTLPGVTLQSFKPIRVTGDPGDPK